MVKAFLFACVICPIFSSRVILERQSAVDVHAAGGGLDTGVGVAVGGLAANELVVVIDINSIAITIVGMATFSPARRAFFTENIIESFRG